MRALVWFVRGILFVVLLGLAVKNSADIELRFYFDAHWLAPLSLIILVVFVAGVLTGLLAALPSWLRQRRSLSRLERQLTASESPSREHVHGN